MTLQCLYREELLTATTSPELESKEAASIPDFIVTARPIHGGTTQAGFLSQEITYNSSPLTWQELRLISCIKVTQRLRNCISTQ